jgi:hypothetical protein
VRRVDEVDEQRATGADPLDRAGLGPNPLRAGWERRHGYVVCLRSHPPLFSWLPTAELRRIS